MSIQELRADYLLNNFLGSNTAPQVNPQVTSQLTFFILFGITLVCLIYLIRKILSFKKSFNESSILLELTPPATTEKSSYTTQQLFSVIHNLGKQRTFIDKLIGKKIVFACEIVSTQKEGIRYLIRTTPDQVSNLKRSLLSYLPQVNVKIVNEYLPEKVDFLSNFLTKVIEFDLTKHFAYPLQKQNVLIEHDPVAYITGMMTKLSAGELVSFQIVLTPTQKNVTSYIKQKILRGEDVLGYINKQDSSLWLSVLKIPLVILKTLMRIIGYVIKTVVSDLIDPKMAQRQAQSQYLMNYASQNLQRPARILTNFEQDVVKSIEEKIDQPLFETKIRIFIGVTDKQELSERVRGFTSSLGVFSATSAQALKKKINLPISLINKFLLLNFRKRLLSFVFNSSPMVLSVSEVSDLYHFPFTRITQTENIIKAHSKELPAPVSLKGGKPMSVIFGKNIYGGSETQIGLSDEERKTHMYIIGRTGSGKTTLMFSMAKQDIESGSGMAFIDPHGDVALDLLECVPESRKNDLIYLNPFDLKHPIGINLLELTPGLDEDEAELEKEVVAEGVVSLFRKVFSKEENANAHRIEYILRNTIHTAFTTEEPTIFTLYNLLNNPTFQKQVVSRLQDENLKNFWKFEFGRAGDYQVVKMVGGVTAKIGRFLFSPTAKRILEQKKSTINFSDILNGKILICNLSQGKLGEDTTRLLGTTILTKIQQAALKRADIPQSKRRQFHLYVDEFQNFATHSFAKMLSEGRKYGLDVCIAEQSTSQQEDRNIVNIILSNVTTVVCFRTGNAIDEQLMLSQLYPYVEQGEIQSLPRYKFYIKMSAIESEEPFSGETIKINVIPNPKKTEKLIETSRQNNAIVYKKSEALKKTSIQINRVEKPINEHRNSSGLPNMPEFQ